MRVAGDPAALASRLREEIRAANPLFRVTTVTSQAAAVDQTLMRERLLAMLSGFFAVVGLVLAAVGLYGVLSLFRGAADARDWDSRRARRAPPRRGPDGGGGGRPAGLVGAGFGLAGGLYLSRFVESLLFEVTPLDFWSPRAAARDAAADGAAGRRASRVTRGACRSGGRASLRIRRTLS